MYHLVEHYNTLCFVCTVYVYVVLSLTTNNNCFPEEFNWLFFVITVDCVLCEKGTQFVAYFLSLCVKKVNF